LRKLELTCLENRRESKGMRESYPESDRRNMHCNISLSGSKSKGRKKGRKGDSDDCNN